jgi:ERCC4-type nuclease
LKIYIDDREPKKMQNLALETWPDAEVTRLVSGDYVCGNIGIERKAAIDFSGSADDGRLERQCKDLVANFEIPIVVLVATDPQIYSNQYFKLHINRFIGVRTDMHHQGVRFDRVNSNGEFIRFCDSMFRKAHDQTLDINGMKRVAPRFGDPYVGMLRQVEGMGEKKCIEVLKQFKIYELFDVSERDLQSIDGIGKVQAKRIKKVFHKKK